MTDEKKKAGGAAFLTQYGEKLALGVSLLALGAGAFVMFGMAGKDPTTPVRSAGQKLKTELGKDHETFKAPKPENWQAQAIGDWNTVPISARAGDNWVASGATTAEGKGKKESVVKKKVVKIPDVLMGQVDVQIDHILVNWAIKDFTREEKQKGAKDFDYAAITHFKLEREVKGKWEVLEPKLDAKILSYRDNKIDAKTPYAYKVTAYSTDKAYLERGTPDPTQGARPNADGAGNVAASASVQTYGLWKLSFANPFKTEGAKGKVYITIEKFEKGVGKVVIKRIQDEGDLIGTWEDPAGGAATSVHKISVPPGRVLEVDWNTGATLVKVQPLKMSVEVEKCQAQIGAMGNMGCKQITEKRQVSTNLIVYTDADGKHELYSPALPDKNEKCPDHGGRPRAAATTAAPADPDAPPPVSAKELARQKKEKDAETLFLKADEALEKQNYPLAKSYYEKLLKDFKETDFVAKDKKLVIEERLAALKDKK